MAGVRIKIERAKRHIRELEAEIRASHARNPYVIIRQDDLKTGDLIYWVKVREYVPETLPGI